MAAIGTKPKRALWQVCPRKYAFAEPRYLLKLTQNGHLEIRVCSQGAVSEATADIEG